jgi:hypothetical protein
MEPTSGYRPRVSRETRLLLTAGLLAIAALWLLARVRFRDRPLPPSPLPAVLGQLTTGPKLDDVAAEVGEVRTRLAPWLVAVEWPPAGNGAPAPSGWMAALRYRESVAIGWLSPRSASDAPAVVAVDRASGVALVRAAGQTPNSSLAAWVPRGPHEPRYLVATDVSAAGVSLRPAFIGSFDTVSSGLWPAPLWALAAGSDLSPGALLFTGNAEFVGMVIAHGGQRAIVPAATLLAEAGRLHEHPPGPAGVLGIGVQAATPVVAAAAGATSGVVVTSVDPAGAAKNRLNVGDVIEAVDRLPVAGLADWEVRMARLTAGQTVDLRGRSRRRLLETSLIAAPAT